MSNNDCSFFLLVTRSVRLPGAPTQMPTWPVRQLPQRPMPSLASLGMQNMQSMQSMPAMPPNMASLAQSMVANSRPRPQQNSMFGQRKYT